MLIKRILPLLSVLLIASMTGELLGMDIYAEAKVTIKVLDEEGNSVENASVGIGFFGSKGENRDGKSDKDGFFTAQSPAQDGEFAFSVKKDGYYDTNGREMIKNSQDKIEQKDGKWQPWNAIYEVVIKKKINPVPMYAKWVEVEIPELNKEIGYDFIVGAWVQPYGKGKISDVLFESIRDDREGWKNFDCSVKMRFPNNGDGIQSYIIDNYKINMGSKLRMRHNAPENNYLREMSFSFGRTPQKGPYGYKSKSGQNYFFRIRTEFDENGNVIKSMYGKIHDDIIINFGGQRKTLGLNFIYYINPDNTRNIEFDPKKNLLIPPGKEYDKEYNGCTNLAP